ncbi:hypothetical protein BD309DRAFT_454902 [Dichomitus squalens]|nr:hypothetical protein BD309DRAFT_454902 [Dichomitus squalens]
MLIRRYSSLIVIGVLRGILEIEACLARANDRSVVMVIAYYSARLYTGVTQSWLEVVMQRPREASHDAHDSVIRLPGLRLTRLQRMSP